MVVGRIHVSFRPMVAGIFVSLASVACGVKSAPLPPLAATPEQSDRTESWSTNGKRAQPSPSPSPSSMRSSGG